MSGKQMMRSHRSARQRFAGLRASWDFDVWRRMTGGEERLVPWVRIARTAKQSLNKR